MGTTDKTAAVPAEDAQNKETESGEVLIQAIEIDLSRSCMKLGTCDSSCSKMGCAKAVKRNKKAYKSSLSVIDEVTVEDKDKEEKLDSGNKKTKRKKGIFRKLIKVFRNNKSTKEDKQVLVEEDKEERHVKKKRRVFSKKALKKAKKRAGKIFVESMHYMAIGMTQMSTMVYYPSYADYYSSPYYGARDLEDGHYRSSFIYVYP